MPARTDTAPRGAFLHDRQAVRCVANFFTSWISAGSAPNCCAKSSRFMCFECCAGTVELFNLIDAERSGARCAANGHFKPLGRIGLAKRVAHLYR